MTRVRAPSDAYAIATLNAKGFGRKELVDAATWHVLRRERIVATGTITTTYDDVRDDQGRVFAHHWHVDNKIAQTTSDSRVTEYVPGAVSDAELARPPSRRALVAFPDGVTSVELTADFADHVYVPVRVGDTEVDFVLDSGASGIVVDTNVAKRAGLRLYGEHAHVVAGRATYARAVAPELHVGPLAMRDVMVGVIPLGWTGKRGGRIGGLLGFDFLAQLGVTIDYAQRRVTVVPGSAYVPPSGPETTALPARFGRGIPLVTASFDGAVAERMGLDTGANGSFLLFDYFTRPNPERAPDDGRRRWVRRSGRTHRRRRRVLDEPGGGRQHPARPVLFPGDRGFARDVGAQLRAGHRRRHRRPGAALVHGRLRLRARARVPHAERRRAREAGAQVSARRGAHQRGRERVGELRVARIGRVEAVFGEEAVHVAVLAQRRGVEVDERGAAAARDGADRGVVFARQAASPRRGRRR